MQESRQIFGRDAQRCPRMRAMTRKSFHEIDVIESWHVPC
jgi:hypothetical protein